MPEVQTGRSSDLIRPPSVVGPYSEEMSERLENVRRTFVDLGCMLNIYQQAVETSIKLKREDADQALNGLNQLLINYLTEMRTDR